MTLGTRTITVIYPELVWILDDGMYRTFGFLELVKPARINRCGLPMLRGVNLSTFLYDTGDMRGDIFPKMIRRVQGRAFFGADFLTPDTFHSVLVDS